jgi:hypothetical protein
MDGPVRRKKKAPADRRRLRVDVKFLSSRPIRIPGLSPNQMSIGLA